MSQALSNILVNRSNVFAFPVRNSTRRNLDDHHWDTDDVKSLLFGLTVVPTQTAKVYTFCGNPQRRVMQANYRFA
ncbi:MAG TPA: hypothetical protein DD416_00305 [Rhodobacteraceae bacterium]|jgi:uncharacterized FAD-dependent dehydrogenase|nr:hypothetical protein [Pseudomonadota bacterium]MDA1284824.1 hypothetical protein [Pseudomonadota bacterium]HBN29683.1 hypothetical protein [Paracoccaceae bacterium]